MESSEEKTNSRTTRKTGSNTGSKATTRGKKKTGRPKGSKSNYTMSEKALAQRNKNIPPAIAKTPEEIAYNSRLIDFIMKTQEIASTTDIKDPETLRSALVNYLNLCNTSGFKITNLSCCAALGVKRSVLDSWLKSDRAEYREIAEAVKMICCMSREQLIADNKLNPVIGIFWQRNYDGLRNDTEQQQTIADQNQDDIVTASDYVKKYGRLLEE